MSSTSLDRAVLITGASTGIGEAAVHAFIGRGFFVFAGVRNREDQVRLEKKSPLVRALILDVTRPEQIQDAKILVQNYSIENFYLVNNAGIVVPGPIETIALDDLKNQFAVNVFGLVEMSQAFLPLLRKTKGRIIHIGSMSGLISAPFVGAYSASKFALEAIADSMRWELSLAGVKVILIEPGPIATPIWQKGLGQKEKLEKSIAGENRDYYWEPLQRLGKLIEGEEKNALPAEAVAKVILRVVLARNPSARIKVASRKTRLQYFFQGFLPTRWIDAFLQSFIFKSKN